MDETPAPHPPHSALLARAAAGPEPPEPVLAGLRRTALAGGGTLLRHEPEAALLRIGAADGGEWLVELLVPEQAAHRPRAGAAARAARLHARIAPALGWPGRALVHEDAGGVGWLARPWPGGAPIAGRLPEQAEAAGEGVAQLHELGFRDPELAPEGLLLREDGALLPLELRRARLRARGELGLEERAADLARLLAAAPADQAAAAARPLLAGYGRLAAPPCRPEELRAAARAQRGAILRRRSRDCLAGGEGFTLDGGLPRRCTPPALQGAVETLWPCTSRARALETFRAFRELELHGLRAARVLAVVQLEDGAAVRALRPDGRAASPEDDRSLLDLGAEFLRCGLALDLDQPGAFRFGPDGRPWLCSPAGLLGPLRG